MALAYQYPDGTNENTGGWSNTPGDIDDPQGSPNDADKVFHSFSTSGGGPYTAEADWSFGEPPTGVSISQIKIWGRSWIRSFNAVTFDADHYLFVRPGGGAATKYYSALLANIVGTTNAQGDTPNWYSNVWTTNPATGAVWTVSDLQGLTAGIRNISTFVGVGHNCFFNCSSLFIEVTYTTTAALAEPTRNLISHHLKSFRNPPRGARIVVPAEYANYKPGDEVDAYQTLHGPAPDGLGWRNAEKSRRDLVILSVEIDPVVREVVLSTKDMKDEEARYWLSAVQDIGFSTDYQGVANVNAGGGLFQSFTRNQTAYVERPGDGSFVDVAANFAKFGKDGLRLDGESDSNSLLNCTFSQGTGTAFTNWTNVTSGTGAIAEETADVLFDVTGLRRAVKVTTGSPAASNAAYLYQSITPASNKVFTLRFFYKNLTAGKTVGPSIIFENVTDSQRFDFSDRTWKAVGSVGFLSLPYKSTPEMVTESDAGYDLSVSGVLSGKTYRLYYGQPNEANSSVILYYADILSVVGLTGSRYPQSLSSVIVTTTATVDRTFERSAIGNQAATPITNLYEAGSNASGFSGRLVLWDYVPFRHDRMTDGTFYYYLLSLYTGREFHDALLYSRLSSTTGRWIFRRAVPNSAGSFNNTDCFVPTGGASALPVPSVGDKVRFALRWTSSNNELGIGAKKMDLFVRFYDASASSWLPTERATQVEWSNDYTDPILWTGLQNVTIYENNGLVESGTGNVWTGSARSSRYIPSGSDGHVQWMVGEVLGAHAVGLSSGAQDTTNPTYDGIEYSIITVAGSAQVFESGVAKGSAWSVLAGERLRVQKVGTTVTYWHNGNLKYTSLTAASAVDYYADAALYLQTGVTSLFRQAVLYGVTLGGPEVGRFVDEQGSQQIVTTWSDLAYPPSILDEEWASHQIELLETSDRVFYTEEIRKLLGG